MNRKIVNIHRMTDKRNDDYVPGTAEYRIGLIWPLTREIASLSVKHDYNPDLFDQSREERVEFLCNIPTHLCRLRYFGDNRWSLGFYTYSHNKYELCVGSG